MLSSVCGSEYTLVQPDQLEHPGDEYTLVQPDQLEHPGDDFVSLFPTFVVNNSSTESIEEIRQSRYCTYSWQNNYVAIKSFKCPILRYNKKFETEKNVE
jgi:hypothetical protein